MSVLKDAIKKSIFNQIDDVTTVPVSVRLPMALSNEIDELSLTLDRSRSFLIIEFIKAGIIEANLMLEEDSALTDETKKRLIGKRENNAARFVGRKFYMLNTNYNNDKETHFNMLKNQEAAAFYKGWKEYIQQLSKGDKVYLYQSGVSIIAVGIVDGELEKSEHYGVADDKYHKSLKDFNTGFKGISARRFKEITGAGANFRRTMVELTSAQAHAISNEIDRLNSTSKKNH
ncbi:CopG family ribbon-helix-helix protein [Pantoea dispersa]|uniref:CopG family ribbon-helix-helix protein n=1 Tax=Pantoea dispersa TaxID=59814 RepID=UPI0039B51504